MANGQDKSLGDGAEPEDLNASAEHSSQHGSPAGGDDGNQAAGSGLPAIASPKLGDGEPETEPDEEPFARIPAFNFTAIGADDPAQGAKFHGFGAYSAPAPAAAAAQPRSYRFALVAAVIALAAGIGSVAGTFTATGLAHRSAGIAVAAAPRAADSRDVTHALRAQLAQLSALRANIEGVARNANSQFARINERVDALQHVDADRAARLAQIAQAIDKLNKRGAAAPEITGSIAAVPPRSAAGPAPVLDGPILPDWIVQEVHNGRAMVESRYGAYFLVGAGSMLPGLGRVEAVRRQDGAWIVVTSRGIITSPR
jgi:hypothetical protein